MRAIEERRVSVNSPPETYKSIYELARHALYLSEMLLTAIVVVESIPKEFGSSFQSRSNASTTKAQREFRFHLSMLQSLLNRSQTL